MFTRFFAALRQFRTANSGTVTVEFVLIIPVLAVVFTVAFGMFHAYLQSSRSAKALYVVSDIVSRFNIVNDENFEQFHELLDALYRGDPDDVNMRVSLVSFVSNDAVADDPTIDVSDAFAFNQGFYFVDWSRFVNQGDSVGTGSGIGSASYDALTAADLSRYSLPTMGSSAEVLLVESNVDYNSPVEDSSFLGMGEFFANLRWKYDVFVWPRDPRGIELEDPTTTGAAPVT